MLSGFQRYFCMQYTTDGKRIRFTASCVIRISKILLYAIHNGRPRRWSSIGVVLSGFQRYFCMQYTTSWWWNPTFISCVIRISKILLYAIHNQSVPHCGRRWVVLSGFQRYFCMQYTTEPLGDVRVELLCYQDFKDTFVCNTQRHTQCSHIRRSCVIRISKILLYAIHNPPRRQPNATNVVLSGFQRYFCMQYTTVYVKSVKESGLCYQDFKDTFVCNTQLVLHCRLSIIVVLSGFQRYFCMQYTTT